MHLSKVMLPIVHCFSLLYIEYVLNNADLKKIYYLKSEIIEVVRCHCRNEYNNKEWGVTSVYQNQL